MKVESKSKQHVPLLPKNVMAGNMVTSYPRQPPGSLLQEIKDRKYLSHSAWPIFHDSFFLSLKNFTDKNEFYYRTDKKPFLRV